MTYIEDEILRKRYLDKVRSIIQEASQGYIGQPNTPTVMVSFENQLRKTFDQALGEGNTEIINTEMDENELTALIFVHPPNEFIEISINI
jgi:hypothetical protein